MTPDLRAAIDAAKENCYADDDAAQDLIAAAEAAMAEVERLKAELDAANAKLGMFKMGFAQRPTLDGPVPSGEMRTYGRCAKCMQQHGDDVDCYFHVK